VAKNGGRKVSIKWKEKFRRQGKKVATLALYASAVKKKLMLQAAGPHQQISCPNRPRCGNFRHVSLIVVIAATDFHRCHQP
jgi:hypothetical protein